MPESPNKAEFFVGVDLGGTKILAGAFTPALKNVGKVKLSTKSDRGVEAVLDRVARCVRDVVDECDLDLKQCRGVGIGAPGSVNFEEGRMIFAPNLDWRDIPMKKELEKRLDVPVFLDNDCNVCTLGVHEREFGGKPRHLIGVFVGTGIGGGIILDGKLFYGANHTAGEIGHMVVKAGGEKCGCGNRGCLEAVASRTAIVNRIQSAIKEGQKTVLTEVLGEKFSSVKSGVLRKAIRHGDKLVREVVEEAAEYLGIGIGNLVNIFNPEMVVLGGGVIDALEDEMFSIVIKRAREQAMAGAAEGLKIVCSQLGNDAGIVGAAVLARKQAK
jgi:glucokinase